MQEPEPDDGHKGQQRQQDVVLEDGELDNEMDELLSKYEKGKKFFLVLNTYNI